MSEIPGNKSNVASDVEIYGSITFKGDKMATVVITTTTIIIILLVVIILIALTN